MKDHYNEKIKGRKIGPQSIFINDYEDKLVEYMVVMGP